ncbi:hypothetical protein EG832_20490 [bacterium]|nr:hypothetical protein [bacterium]
MNNFFGDRFLRLFAGDLKHRQKRTLPNIKDQNSESITEGAAELVTPASEEGQDKNLPDRNHLLNEEEQSKKNDTEH